MAPEHYLQFCTQKTWWTRPVIMPGQRNWSSVKRAEQSGTGLAAWRAYCHQNVRDVVNYAEEGAGYSVGLSL